MKGIIIERINVYITKQYTTNNNNNNDNNVHNENANNNNSKYSNTASLCYKTY